MSLLGDNDKVKYLISGDEVGECGTPHIQGFVVFTRAWRFARVKEALGDRAHIEVARGTSVEASEYCKKEGKFAEYGVCPPDTRLTSAGEAGRWDRARELAGQGRFDDIESSLYVRYRNSFHSIYEDACGAKDCIDVLEHLWIYGGTGIGKSRYCWDRFPGSYRDWETDRKSTRLNSSHSRASRMPSSA